MKPTILIDLDGVLCDFVSSVCKVLNATYPDPWPSSTYSIADALGISEKDFWKAIDKEGYQFWSNLKEYSYAKDLYKRLCDRYTVYFCSTPSDNCESLKGKKLWLDRFVGKNCKNYVFTKDKSLLASSRTLLLDDYEENTKKFTKAGGFAYLFPQCWNSNWKLRTIKPLDTRKHNEDDLFVTCIMDAIENFLG